MMFTLAELVALLSRRGIKYSLKYHDSNTIRTFTLCVSFVISEGGCLLCVEYFGRCNIMVHVIVALHWVNMESNGFEFE